ncbi:MAG: hypothetical protein ACI9UT_001636 [Flavobacteriales bacterium]|jgi:hypothetical protein
MNAVQFLFAAHLCFEYNNACATKWDAVTGVGLEQHTILKHKSVIKLVINKIN